MDKMVSILRSVSQSEDEGTAIEEDQKRVMMLEKLAVAVDKLQEKYSQGSDKIKACEEVEHLCAAVRDILNHGLREGLMSFVTEVSFWPVLQLVTCKEAIDQISRLELTKDRDKCDAWILLAVKDNILGSYIDAISQDDEMLRYYYQPYAFLCDKEKTCEAQQLLMYGVSNFDFDFDLTGDNQQSSIEEEKDSSVSPVVGSPESSSTSVEDLNEQPQTEQPQTTDVKPKKRKSKKKSVRIGNLVDEHSGTILDPYSYDSMYYEFDVSAQDNEKESDKNDSTITPESASVDKNSPKYSSERTDGSLTTNDSLKDCFTNENDFTRDDLSASLETSEFVRNLRHMMESETDFESGINRNDTEQVESSNVSGTSPSATIEKNKLQYAGEIIGNTSKPVFDMSSVGMKGEKEDQVRTESLQHFRDRTTSMEDDTSFSSIKRSQSFDTPAHMSSSLGDVEQRFPADDFRNLRRGNTFDNDQYSRPHLSRASSTNSVPGSSSWTSTGESRRSTLGSRTSSVDRFSRFDNELLSSSVESSQSGGFRDFESLSELEMFDDLLGLEENHFSAPESFMGLSTVEELQHAIESCKALVKTKSSVSEERMLLIQRLVKLRLKLQEEKEQASKEEDGNVKKVLGHEFLLDTNSSKAYCDRCGKTIWTLWQSLFVCTACKFHSHRKCMETISRPCASKKVTSAGYIIDICPETGLSTQQYRCAECRHKISVIKEPHSEARLCDYSGQYFCENCHWNDTMIIPARVVHNWDFSPRKVSCQAKQQLRLMQSKPLLPIQQLNPKLFGYVEELREINKLREDILIMKNYFVSCKDALESKLLLKLSKQQHFVENTNMYSMEDLIGVYNGQLVKKMMKIVESFTHHIKQQCQLCRGRGFICELCESKEIIFAFDAGATQCPQCQAVYHRKCLTNVDCPRCKRIQKRSQVS